jgi:ATP-dependent Lon protease
MNPVDEPVFTDAGESSLTQELELPGAIPILPLRNTVLFPGVIIPITVARPKSIHLVRTVARDQSFVGLIAQKTPGVEEPVTEDLYGIGTVAKVVRILDMPDGNTTVLMQGYRRFRLERLESDAPFLTGQVSLLEDKVMHSDEATRSLIGSVRDTSLRIIELSNQSVPEASLMIRNIEDGLFLINFIASNSNIKLEDRQQLLEMDDPVARCHKLLELLLAEVQYLELKHDIQSKVRSDIEQNQRAFMLQQQMRTIQEELGEDPVAQERKDLLAQADAKKWTSEVRSVFDKEWNKWERMQPASPEYAIQHNYLMTMLDLPWGEYTRDRFQMKVASEVLDKDHYGLEKVKDRILEHLAVLKLRGDMRTPILCLVGPPGVGKTSLGKSVARALKRKYIRISLGGLHDESEIRGHRKTYIGAMPGRIIQSIRKARSSNPVFVLDEIDKVGYSAQGDPASALLEVLDPEQNSTFHDNYLEVDYDLSKVMFIATANTLSTLSPALRDRMEVIELGGYLPEEKLEIARRHILPRLFREHGVRQGQFSLSDETILAVIAHYTRESGVRTLEKMLASLLRYAARNIASGSGYVRDVSADDLQGILGVARYSPEVYSGNDYPGVVTGLAWTAAGGEILYVEAALSKGDGKLTLTGNLGEVMKESAVIAWEYLKSHPELFSLGESSLMCHNVHIHVPEGAIPKDGPSAGVTMVTALASAFTGRKVRPHLAMTAEITLRGKLLPVGGIREKILAARRSGIREILLAKDNDKEVGEIPEAYREDLSFVYFSDLGEAIRYALL